MHYICKGVVSKAVLPYGKKLVLLCLNGNLRYQFLSRCCKHFNHYLMGCRLKGKVPTLLFFTVYIYDIIACTLYLYLTFCISAVLQCKTKHVKGVVIYISVQFNFLLHWGVLQYCE